MLFLSGAKTKLVADSLPDRFGNTVNSFEIFAEKVGIKEMTTDYIKSVIATNSVKI